MTIIEGKHAKLRNSMLPNMSLGWFVKPKNWKKNSEFKYQFILL